MPYSDPEANREYHREYSRKYQAANLEVRRENNRKWRAANPEKNRASARAADRKYREANRGARREYARKYRTANAEKVRAGVARWAKANPEKIYANASKRRARIMGADATLTTDEWLDRLEEFGHHCAYCYGTERIAQDHIIPLSRGGTHTLDNVVPACRSCNSSKHARTHVEFLLRFGPREDGADALLR